MEQFYWKEGFDVCLKGPAGGKGARANSRSPSRMTERKATAKEERQRQKLAGLAFGVPHSSR